jgi:hypothetical protein
LGLDKWISPEDKAKKKKKQPPKLISETSSKYQKKKPSEVPKTLNKYTLICPKAKCKYQKVLVKRFLTDNDKICPKCKGQMKIK